MKQGSQSVFKASRVWNLKFSVDAILGQHSACLGAKCAIVLRSPLHAARRPS